MRLSPRWRRSASCPATGVCLVLPNCPQFFVAQLGVWKAGAIVVPLNPTYTEREFKLAVRNTGTGTRRC